MKIVLSTTFYDCINCRYYGLFVGFISFNFCLVPNCCFDRTLSTGARPSFSICLFSWNRSFRIWTYSLGGCGLGCSDDDGLGFFDDDGGSLLEDIVYAAIKKNTLVNTRDTYGLKII